MLGFFCWNFYSLKNECFVLESGLYICWHLVAFLLMRKTQNTMSMNFFYIPCFNVAASGEEIRQTSNILQISTLQNICIMVCLFVKLIFKGIIFRRSEMCRNVIKTDYSILVSILKIVEYVRFSLEFRLWPNTDMYNLDHFYWYECNISRNIQSKCSATIFPLNQFSSVNKYKYTTLLFQHKSKLRFV